MYLSPLMGFCFLTIFMVNSAAAQLIVAHRGASYDAPENTMAAFHLAWKQNADVIEGDFRLTSDNEIVCIHDADTARVCPTKPVVKIADTDLETLRKLDVGRWKDAKYAGEKIPTLADVLAIVPDDKQIAIEIKTGPEILPVLQQQLARSLQRPSQIILICFDAEVIQQARKLMPQYHANWLTKYELRKRGNQQAWHPTVDAVLKTLNETGATGLGSQAHETVIDQAFVTAVANAGKEFHVWTVDDPAFAAKLKAWGTSSLTTNRPQYLRAQLESTDNKPDGSSSNGE